MNNLSDKQYDLFLSYGRGDDLSFVKKLYIDLVEQGYKVWFDNESLESNGISFLQSIRDSLATNRMRFLLVIGPHAAKSDYVQYEWEFAIANCMVIIPLLRMGNDKDQNGLSKMSDLDYDLLPVRIKKRKLHCIDFRRERYYVEALEELLRNLSGPISPLATSYSVPNKPANFISRDKEVEKLKEIIMGDNYLPGVITSVGKSTAVQGMGGIGKSVLASAICHDCDVKRSFSDGIYWVTVGQQQPELNVTKAVQLLTGNSKTNLNDNFEEAKNEIRKSLKEKNCLIILDDVWEKHDIKIFLSDEALRCRILITTRSKQTVQNLVATIVQLDLMNDADARLLLAKAASGNAGQQIKVTELPVEADAIINECGHLPLAIDMAGGMISAGDASRWKDVLTALQDMDLAYFEHQFPDYPYPNLLKVLDVSVALLEYPIKSKFFQLAIFPKDAIIPQDVIHILWKKEGEAERVTNKLLDELVARSLIQRSTEGLYLLHDLQADYLKATCKDIQGLNKDFISRLGDPLLLTDEYAWNNYIWHLKEAGEIATATRLLQSFEWIEAKLFATGINNLLKDYEYYKLDAETSLIYRTLKLSAHVLSENKSQVAAQLVGRLMGAPGLIIQQLIDKAKQWQKEDLLWMRPKTMSLIPPGNLAMTLKGETLVTVRDGRIISESEDGGIRIWDLGMGIQIGEPIMKLKAEITRLEVIERNIIVVFDDKTIF